MVEQLIIGFSGRKQSGKGTICQYLTEQTQELFGWRTRPQGLGDVHVQTFSFAAPLKRFCVAVLGLAPCQVYGSDDEKNTLTRYLWEDLPHYGLVVATAREQDKPAPRGYMTARQLLQEVGTGIFRRMWGDIWAQACLYEIRKSGVHVAMIDDTRFPNEVFAIQAAGGKVCRLMRAPFKGHDEHISEKALDPDVFDQAHFNQIVMNQSLTPDETAAWVVGWLTKVGWAKTAKPRRAA